VSDTLERLVEQLEQAAAQLREGNLDAAEAAAVVEACADLAAKAGSELDRLAREPDEPLPGQEELL
jgi:soluble cytochrome b562